MFLRAISNHFVGERDLSNDALDLIQAGDADELRAQCIWLIASVTCATWGFFCIFLSALGYDLGGLICFQQSLVYICSYFLFRKSKNYSLIINFILICGAVGLWGVSLAGKGLGPTIYFLPISIIMCSQLFGIKMAFRWTAISVLTMMSYFAVMDWGVADAVESSAHCLLSFGIPVCMYFCCQQAEKYYSKKTSNLINFSKTLQKKSAQLEVLATTDSLTKLTNRYQFQRQLDSRVERAGDSGSFALFLIDMDGFKEINDTMGHSVGDEVLIEIAKRLENHFGDHSIVARLGGDEFCLLIEGVSSLEQAGEFANEAHRVLTRRYVLEANGFALGSSVGYVICPEHAGTAKHLLAYADTAMYHAKHNQLSVAAYSPDMTERLIETHTMKEQLSVALERNEFFLVYQPQVDIETGKVVGVEALLRWRNGDRVVSPATFIPLLEQSGRIIEVSRWIIRESCRQHVEWKDQLGIELPIAVNVSAVQFQDGHFVESVVEPIREFNVDPGMIELEITEGVLINNIPEVVKKLEEIKEIGMPISIDDFGTGYSSMAYLRQFPIDKLKIDRAFVKDIPDNDDGVIASSIIVLGQLLGMGVLAEGVETQEQLEHLKSNGCDQYQGYLFSKPVSPEGISQLFAANSERNSALVVRG